METGDVIHVDVLNEELASWPSGGPTVESWPGGGPRTWILLEKTFIPVELPMSVREVDPADEEKWNESFGGGGQSWLEP